MKILIVPSLSEPFGMVALEALASGANVVITKGAGVTEFVPDLVQVDAWDEYRFMQEINQLLDDEVFAENKFKSCHKSLMKLNPGASAEMIEGILGSVVRV